MKIFQVKRERTAMTYLCGVTVDPPPPTCSNKVMRSGHLWFFYMLLLSMKADKSSHQRLRQPEKEIYCHLYSSIIMSSVIK